MDTSVFYVTGINSVNYLSTILIVVLVNLGVAYLGVLVWRRYTFVSIMNKIPPIPGALPLVGNVYQLPREHTEMPIWIKELLKKYFIDQNITCFWLGPKPVVLILRAEAVEKLLSSSSNLKKSVEYTFIEPWLGTGLLTSYGAKWRSRRKLLTPAFHFRILEDFIHVINKECEIMVNKLVKMADSGDVFDITPFVALCALDIICGSAMGVSMHAQEKTDSEYVKALKRICDIIHTRQMNPLYHPDWLFNILPLGRESKRCIQVLHGFTRKVIQARKEERKKQLDVNFNDGEDNSVGIKKRQAFLDMLLETSEQGAQLSDEDIREEVDTFMFEGHDTTMAATVWSLFVLGLDANNQVKAQEELDGIFGDSDRPATTEDLKEMKFLECCIKEALRLMPSVPMIGRELEESIEIDGYHIPAGVTAVIMIGHLHRDPRYFPDDDPTFHPENFFPENCKGRHPFAYIPFSAGPRNCIGQKFALMEEKVMLSSILRKFNVTSMDKANDVKVIGELILKPAIPIRIKLSHRQENTS